MTALLKLMVTGDYKANGATVVAHVRSLAGGPQQHVRVTVGVAKDIQVDPGRHLVEVVLPSGERLRDVADLSTNPVFALTLAPLPSPREWLGLQRMLVPRARLGRPEHQERIAGSAAPPDVFPFEDWNRLCKEVQRAVQVGTGLDLGDAQRLYPRHHDQVVYLFEISPDAIPAGNGAWAGGVAVRLPDRILVVPVARRWITLGGSLVPTELAVNAERRTLSVAIEDPRFTLLLGYLASGRSELAAEALGELPQDLLYDKMQNPLAAAAGAYILVEQLHDAARRPVWRKWIDNLANWFPGLPDGAILQGRALLHEEKADAACERFIDGFERGIPFFGAGVRMLLSGLLSFRDDAVPPRLSFRFQIARDEVRRWATWIDPQQSFTALSPDIDVTARDEGAAPLTVVTS